MGMIVHQLPGINAGFLGPGLIAHAGQKILAILIVVNDIGSSLFFMGKLHDTGARRVDLRRLATV
jgi:hypothetical protein